MLGLFLVLLSKKHIDPAKSNPIAIPIQNIDRTSPLE